MGWMNRLYKRFLLARRLPGHWQLRPRTLDRRIAFHVLVENEYRMPGPVWPGDLVLDIGAHVGTFALAAIRAGAGTVVCYEPDADNFRLLAHNLAPFGEAVHLHKAAVWRSDETNPALTLCNPHTARNTGAHRVASFQYGSPLDAVAFDEVVEGLTHEGRRIGLLKLDCEGAEWPILLTSNRLESIDAICGEYHLGPLPEMFAVARHPEYSPELLEKTLTEQGFAAHLEPLPPRPHPCGLFFASRHEPGRRHLDHQMMRTLP